MGFEMTQKSTSFFHLHLISDSTGETLITVARAAAAQYAGVRADRACLSGGAHRASSSIAC